MDEKQRAFQEFERRGWEDVARSYGDLVGPITSQIAPALLDAAGVAGGRRVLDVATGPGFVAAEAAARGSDAVGLDIAEAMVEEASRRHPGLEFRVGRAEALPFGDSEFDAVTSSFGMPHFADHEAFFSESRRVLRPGGRIAFATWKPGDDNALWRILHGAITQVGRPDPPGLPEGPDVFAYADGAKCAPVLGAAGFLDVRADDRTVECRADGGAPELLRFVEGTVRTRALYESQTEAEKVRIGALIEEWLEPFRRGHETRVPASVVVVSACRP